MMYQVIIIEGHRHEVLGNHRTLDDATEALWRCVACSMKFHFAVLRPDGSLSMMVAGGRF